MQLDSYVGLHPGTAINRKFLDTSHADRCETVCRTTDLPDILAANTGSRAEWLAKVDNLWLSRVPALKSSMLLSRGLGTTTGILQSSRLPVTPGP